MKHEKPLLISFKICPYVQRSSILLFEKKIDFDVKYIDLPNKPEWFLHLSPLGKVPVLQINNTVVFESAVINELLDEIHPPRLHPEDPFLKAHNRSWIEFSSALLGSLYPMIFSKDKKTFVLQQKELLTKLTQLEKELAHQPWFNGDLFSLVDIAYAPLFLLFDKLEKINGLNLLESFPKIASWSKNILGRESVKKAEIKNHIETLSSSLKEKESYFISL